MGCCSSELFTKEEKEVNNNDIKSMNSSMDVCVSINDTRMDDIESIDEISIIYEIIKGFEFDTKNVRILKESKIVINQGFNSAKTIYGILITPNNIHSESISILVCGFVRQNTYTTNYSSQIIIEYMGNSIFKSLLIYEYKNKIDYLGTQKPIEKYENINNIGQIYISDNNSFKMNYKTKIISFKFGNLYDLLSWITALTDDGNNTNNDDTFSTVSGSSDDDSNSCNCGYCYCERNAMTHVHDCCLRDQL